MIFHSQYDPFYPLSVNVEVCFTWLQISNTQTHACER